MGNPCRRENDKFESYYPWLDEFIFRTIYGPHFGKIEHYFYNFIIQTRIFDFM